MSKSLEVDAYLRSEIAKTSKLIVKDSEISEKIAIAVVYTLNTLLSGEQIYFTKKNARELRHAQIKAEFKGDNRAEICQRYNISQSTFYRLISR